MLPAGHYRISMMTQPGEEAWAARVIEAELGVAVVQNDFNTGTSTYDLRIGAERAPDAAIEVVTARHRDMESLRDALEKRAAAGSQGQWFEPGSGVQGRWHVLVRGESQLKDLMAELSPIIAEMEASGARNPVELGRDAEDLAGLERQARIVGQIQRLGVNELFRVDSQASGPPRIYIDATPAGEAPEIPTSVTPLARWCGEFLKDPKNADNLAKLSVNSKERHMFIPVAFGGAPAEIQAFLMHDVLKGSPPPVGDQRDAPDIPEPITHVWVVSTSSRFGLRWDGSTWQVFDARPSTSDE